MSDIKIGDVVPSGQFAGEIAAEGSLWVVSGFRVYEITAWRVCDFDYVIATVPGTTEPQLLFRDVNVFTSERKAWERALIGLDHMRRFYDDLAERAIKRLVAIKDGAKPA